MNPQTAKHDMEALLSSIGITINGHHPWDIQVHNEQFYSRVMSQGPLGLGESYMDKWWECERLDTLFDKVLRVNLDMKIKIPLRYSITHFLARIINFQSKKRVGDVARQHYDLGNTLFKAMLDKNMLYSCGYWKNAKNLDEAQIAKVDLVCRKLQLKRGSRLLDIGCGWGGLARYAAENYGVSVVGITISKQQFDYATERCKGLPVEIRLQDYRDVSEHFDNIVSIGMFEHVGHLNYSTYMQTAHRCLKKDGLFLLHTIGVDQTNYLTNEWTLKYIFPNGMLPSIAQIAKAAEPCFTVEDWHNFGADYDPTLMAWHHRFLQHWPELRHLYDERFFRMWAYYLLTSAGSFRARSLQLWQVVFSKKGIPGGYVSVR